MRYNKGTYAVVMFASNPGIQYIGFQMVSLMFHLRRTERGRKNWQGKTETAQQLFCFNKVNVMN